MVAGPTVLTIEYEPIPRGFAVPLLLFAVGLAAQWHDWERGWPPLWRSSIIADNLCLLVVLLGADVVAVAGRIGWNGVSRVAPLAIAVPGHVRTLRLLHRETERQVLLGTIDPEMGAGTTPARLLQLGLTWIGEYWRQYALLWLLSLAPHGASGGSSRLS